MVFTRGNTLEQWRAAKTRASKLKWRNANLEKANAALKRWTQENPEKVRKAKQAWKKRNAEHIRAVYYAWKSNNHERVLAISRRSKHKSYRENPEPQRERSSAWKRENPEKVKAQAQKRLSLKHGCGGAFTGKEWLLLCEFYSHICLCCKLVKNLTADHVVPLSKGGSNNIENIQPLCLSCNSHKATKTIDYRPGFPLEII